MEFAENISKVGTQPIIGTQINFKFKDHIGILPIIAIILKVIKVLLVYLQNLTWKTKLQDEPHCLFQELLKIKSGVTVLSGSFRWINWKLISKNLLTED